MDDKAATQILRRVVDAPMGAVLSNGRAPSAGPPRTFVAGRTLLDSSQSPGTRLDQPKSRRRQIAGLNSGALEPSARPFNALGELGIDYCAGAEFERFKSRVIQELNADVFAGQVAHTATVYETKPATITLAELQRSILICEEIIRRSPFQLSQFMPKDCPHLVKVEGKYYFGLYRWQEFNSALAGGSERAMALLLEWKILNIDAAMDEHQRKWGDNLDAEIKSTSPDTAARFRKAFRPV